SLARSPGDVREAGDDIDDLGLRHLARTSEAFQRNIQRDSRWCERHFVHRGRCLPAGVPDLHPEMVAGPGAGPGVAAQRIDTAIVVARHVARAFEAAAIGLAVAGYQEPCAAARPAAIEADVAFGRAIVVVGKTLGHCRFPDTVREPRTAGER